MGPRLSECCWQGQAEVVNRSTNKIHATWGPPFSRALTCDDDCDHHGECDCGEPVSLEEGHQEAEPAEQHHVHVQDHCNGKKQYKYRID